jgi:hydroxyacid-oxoacid transhydrogenase
MALMSAHVHSPPVAGLVRDFQPQGYEVDHAMVPHGMSVILNTPAVVRFTAPACPERHLRAAQALGGEVSHARPGDAGRILADLVIAFMRRLKMPNGLAEVGYSDVDIPSLVQGTLPQHRVTKLSPRPASEVDLTMLFRESLTIW